MKFIKEFIFGVRAQGEPVLPPKFKTIEPTSKPTQDKWVKQMKFGSRYGYRGSFYNNR